MVNIIEECNRDFLDLLKTIDKVTYAAVSEDPSGATFGIGQYLGYNRRGKKIRSIRMSSCQFSLSLIIICSH